MTAPSPTTSASSSRRAHRRPAPLRPPALRVPRYDHVFLFYFENQDVHAIVGNRRQAPYFNSLLPQGSELGDFFAEEHPSDANYLALAGGSAFGIPLDDPLEYDSQYTIHARNIGDLVDAAHETWRAYNAERRRPVRRHRARLLLGRRPAVPVLRRHPAAAGLLRHPRPAAGVDGARPRQRRDDAQLRLGRLQRLRRHGGMRHPRRRPLPEAAARRRSCARRPGGPSGRWPSSPGTRTTTTTSDPRNGSRRSSSGSRRGQARLRLAGPLHALQPAAHDRGRAGAGASHRQRPLRPAGQRRLHARPVPDSAAPPRRPAHGRARAADRVRRQLAGRAPSPRSRLPPARAGKPIAWGATRRRSR